ncbi:unnamed protein product [Mucor hiemalis]
MAERSINQELEDGSTTTCRMVHKYSDEKVTSALSTTNINKQVEKHIKTNEGLNTASCKIPNPQLLESSHNSPSTSHHDTTDVYNTIENIDSLRVETKKLYAKYTNQAAKIKKLEFDLEMEQGHVNILRHDNQSLRKLAVDMTALTEQEEEYISNKLLKHITGLKKEKGELLVQVEQEEEYLTNMLQKKLVQLQKEKIDLENALEQEQEYMVNRLQKQLDALRQQQQQQISSPSSRISDPSSIIASLPVSPAITGIGSSPSFGAKKWNSTIANTPQDPPPGLVDVLKAEVNSLRIRAAEMEREYFQKQQQCNKYKNELILYRKENNLPLDDIVADDGRLPRVFRSIPPPSTPSGERSRAPRSASNSSQRSVTPLQLNPSQSTSSTTTLEHSFYSSPHSSVLPQAIPGTSSNSSSGYYTSRSSPSVSSSSASSSLQRKTEIAPRRVSGNLFGLSSTPPQHPPQL